MKAYVFFVFVFCFSCVFAQEKNLIHYLSAHVIDQAYKSDRVVGIRYQDYKKPLGPHRRYFTIMRDSRKNRRVEFYVASPPEQLLQSSTQRSPAMQNSQFQANQIMVQAQEALMSSIVSDGDSGRSFFDGGASPIASDWGNPNEMDAMLQSFSPNPIDQPDLKQFVKVNSNIHYWDGDVVKSGKVWYTINDGQYFFIALDNGFFVEPKIK